MFFLLVRDNGLEGGRGAAVRIEAQSGIEIGRNPECKCRLLDQNVGRKAARIVEDRGVLYVEDMGSTNRTSIRGGRKLGRGEREALRHGLFIDVGKSSIEIEEQRSSQGEKTDAGQATNAGVEEETEGGDRTIVGRPPSTGLRTAIGKPPSGELDDMQVTIRGPSPIPPPPPAPRPAAVPQPTKRSAPPAAQVRAPETAPAPVPAEHSAPQTPRESSHGHSATNSPSSMSSAFLGPAGLGGATQSILPSSSDLGVIGTMITRRPRLVIVNEADRRIVPIERVATMIGRESGEIRIDHKAISQPHAMIRFIAATNNFQIEDRKSKNQTFVGGLALNPEQSHLLAPECLIRFGPIEAVFVVDRDGDNAPVPPAQYEAAARYLIEHNQATPEQVRAAQEDSKQIGTRHVGEALMLSGVISARAWTKAFECGRNMPAPSAPRRGRRAILFGVLFVVLVVVLAYLFRDSLGLSSK